MVSSLQTSAVDGFFISLCSFSNTICMSAVQGQMLKLYGMEFTSGCNHACKLTCNYFVILSHFFKSRGSSVVIALGYGLDDRSSGVRFPAEAGNFSLNHRVQNGSGAHPASYPMDTRGSFPRGKAAGE
jgi:hypothetical protein